MFKSKKTKLIEVFEEKFDESCLNNHNELKYYRNSFRNRVGGQSTRVQDLSDFVQISSDYLNKILQSCINILNKYLQLIKPKEIDSEKFYMRLKEKIEGNITGHIRSLNQNLNELRAMNNTYKNAPVGFQFALQTQINGLENNLKKKFEKEIKDLLFDYNLNPQNLWSRIKEQVILIIIGAVFGAAITLIVNFML